MIMPSAGVHVTLPDYYSPEHLGMIVPKTKDGRVVFMLPWLSSTIAGTTGASVIADMLRLQGWLCLPVTCRLAAGAARRSLQNNSRSCCSAKQARVTTVSLCSLSSSSTEAFTRAE